MPINGHLQFFALGYPQMFDSSSSSMRYPMYFPMRLLCLWIQHFLPCSATYHFHSSTSRQPNLSWILEASFGSVIFKIVSFCQCLLLTNHLKVKPFGAWWCSYQSLIALWARTKLSPYQQFNSFSPALLVPWSSIGFLHESIQSFTWATSVAA